MEDSVALGEVVLSGEWEERPRKEVEVPIHPLPAQGRTGVSVHHRRGGEGGKSNFMKKGQIGKEKTPN